MEDQADVSEEERDSKQHVPPIDHTANSIGVEPIDEHPDIYQESGYWSHRPHKKEIEVAEEEKDVYEVGHRAG